MKRCSRATPSGATSIDNQVNVKHVDYVATEPTLEFVQLHSFQPSSNGSSLLAVKANDSIRIHHPSSNRLNGERRGCRVASRCSGVHMEGGDTSSGMDPDSSYSWHPCPLVQSTTPAPFLPAASQPQPHPSRPHSSTLAQTSSSRSISPHPKQHTSLSLTATRRDVVERQERGPAPLERGRGQEHGHVQGRSRDDGAGPPESVAACMQAHCEGGMRAGG